MKKYIEYVVVIAVAFLLSYVFIKPVQNVVNNLGATPGGDFTNKVNFMGGVQNSTLIATTSMGTSITISASEFTKWADASIVSLTPGLVAAATFTLPASSTVPSLVPKPGDKQEFCIRNATTTASTHVILAGSTGINLVVASSSATAVGGKMLNTGKVGCITLIRQPSTASTFDIDALLTVYQ